MLFDLRGRGRRRTIQVIYLSLALLLGGGLVLFGIGGDVQGGLFDAFSQNEESGNETFKKEVEDAEKKVRANRQDAAAWAQLAQAKIQLAGVSKGFDKNTGQFGGESRRLALDGTRAWEQHLELAGEKPDSRVARTMSRTYLQLDDPDKALQTQQVVLEADPDPDYGDFALVAEYAYTAGNTRVGDNAARQALEDAKEEEVPKERRDEIKARLDALKAQAAQQAVEDAQGAAGGAPATP